MDERERMRAALEVIRKEDDKTNLGEDSPDPEVIPLLDMKLGEVPRVLATPKNVATILENDRRWRDRIRFNQFDNLVNIFHDVDCSPMSDPEEMKIRIWLDTAYRLRVPTRMVHEVVMYIGWNNRYHPVVDYLESLEWDGQPRVIDLFPKYFGAFGLLNEALGRCFLISAVARVMSHDGGGCKVDTTVVLYSAQQGTRKSSAIRELAGAEWFSDSALDLQGGMKDAYQSLAGVWIYELGELDSINKARSSSVKSFLSAQVDRYRPSHGRNVVRRTRQCVFVATTNSKAHLKDPTGSRRFWPIAVGNIDLEAIKEDRDQLWAEAKSLYDAGTRWWLNEDESKNLAEASESFTEVDPWSDIIAEWLDVTLRSEFTTAMLLNQCLQKPSDRITRRDELRVATILRSFGYDKERKRVEGRRRYVWNLKGAQ